MEKSTMDAISRQIRDLFFEAFEVAGKDFERDVIVTRDTNPDEIPVSPWMTRAEAARYAHVSTDTIDNWCAAKHIERAKLGTGRPGSVLIVRDSLEQFLRSRIDNRSKRTRKEAPSVKGGYRVSKRVDKSMNVIEGDSAPNCLKTKPHGGGL